jgi:hypothetical protein
VKQPLNRVTYLCLYLFVLLELIDEQVVELIEEREAATRSGFAFARMEH